MNNDRLGRTVPLDECRPTSFGLYVVKSLDYLRAFRMETWLLPALGIRVTDFWMRPGLDKDEDFYIDIADTEVEDGVWRSVDHYLDIAVRTGHDTEVLDADEFVAAVGAGYLDAETAQRALETTHRTLAGIVEHGHDVNAWLVSVGIELPWLRHS